MESTLHIILLTPILFTRTQSSNSTNSGKQILSVRPNSCREGEQELGDDLSVCAMNILPKVSSLPSLLAINLMKMEICIFQTITWPHVVRLIEGSCLGASSTMSVVVSINLLQVEICILFVTWPNKTTPLRCHGYLWVTAPRRMSLPWKVWWP